MSKYKIRNAHCVYFEWQTGLCKAKEFVKCNPINCKLYAIDELSTIVDLQEQLKRKEQECEQLKAIVTEAEEAPICFHCSEEPCIRQERDKYKQALDEIEKFAKNDINFKYNDKRFTVTQISNIINKVKGN